VIPSYGSVNHQSRLLSRGLRAVETKPALGCGDPPIRPWKTQVLSCRARCVSVGNGRPYFEPFEHGYRKQEHQNQAL